MAFKVPVVATAVGGVPELIEDGINGFTVPSKDCTRLAEKIIELAKNKTLQEKFKNEGFRTIIEKFSFEKQAEVLYSVYRDVCRK
jgi:glycosyltransferase involved in cell wall biosynthesis